MENVTCGKMKSGRTKMKNCGTKMKSSGTKMKSGGTKMKNCVVENLFPYGGNSGGAGGADGTGGESGGSGGENEDFGGDGGNVSTHVRLALPGELRMTRIESVFAVAKSI